MEFSRQEYTGVGSHSLLQGIFLTQGSNPGLLHCRWFLYCLESQAPLFQKGDQVHEVVQGALGNSGKLIILDEEPQVKPASSH